MERLYTILSDINSEIDFEREENLIGDGLFESFDILQCVMACEEEFGIEIPPEVMVVENFTSARAIWGMIRSLADEQGVGI